MNQSDDIKYQFFSKIALIISIIYLLPILVALLVFIDILPAYVFWKNQIIGWNEIQKPWIFILLSLSIIPGGIILLWLVRFPEIFSFYKKTNNFNKLELLEQVTYENSQMRASLQQYYELEKSIIALSQQKQAYYTPDNNKTKEEKEDLIQRIQYFLRQTSLNLANNCVIDTIFIAEFQENNKQDLNTRVSWNQGHFHDKQSWSLDDFPDTGGIENDVFIYHNALSNYPSKLIKYYKAQSYFSIPLYTLLGEQIGLLCLMSAKKNTLIPDLLIVLNLYAHYVSLLLSWEKQLKTVKPSSKIQIIPEKNIEFITPLKKMVPNKSLKDLALKIENKNIPILNQHLKILIAEDSEINQVVIRKILMRLGYQAHYAQNGAEAVQLWEKNHYDLILMDCQMPIMDGYQATKSIRQIEQAKNLNHTIIIALTTYTLNKHKEFAKIAGMDADISIPIKVDILQNLLAQYANTAKDEKHTIKPLNLKVSKIKNKINHIEVNKPKSTILNPVIIQDLHKTLGKQIHVLLREFIENLPEQIATLKQAIKIKDKELLRCKAHQIKTESIKIGAETLSCLCKELEMLACHNELEQAEKHVTLMSMELKNVINALQQENEK